MKPPIVLLTDFGTKDYYVGVMKGVILDHCPGATIVDLCHELPPQDIRAGAYCLRASVSYFPKGAIFVAVVDPGVGSSRRVIWGRSARHQFLAPDNGVLSWIEEEILEAREVRNEKLWLPSVSATFHGRDIFAPVAGRLARGLASSLLGPKVRDMKRIPVPRPKRAGRRVRGELLWLDRFGNAVTSLGPEDAGRASRIFFRGRDLGPVRSHYAQAPQGKPLALFGSSGYLELSVRDGSFARRYRASVGDPVESRK